MKFRTLPTIRGGECSAAATSDELIAHKKGRCKRSGQGKTLDQGATNQRQ